MQRNNANFNATLDWRDDSEFGTLRGTLAIRRQPQMAKWNDSLNVLNGIRIESARSPAPGSMPSWPFTLPHPFAASSILN
jgi:hypothetical protein